MAYSTGSTPQPTDAAGDGVEITAPRARGAYKGRRILWILLASLAAVIVAFLVAYATNPTNPVASKQGAGRVTSSAAQAFNAPAPQPKNPG